MNQSDLPLDQKVKSITVETTVTLAVIAVIAFWCARILSPFLSITLWGAIIAVSIYTPYKALVGRLGGRRKLASTLIVLLGIALIILPMVQFTSSMLSSVGETRAALEAGTLSVPTPGENVKDWPVVGERVYEQWNAASENLREYLGDHAEQTRAVVSTALGKLAGLGIGALQFFVSLIIAAAFLAGADTVTAFMRRLFNRLADDNGDALRSLAVQTIRSVAVGVLGIAAIQAVLAGIGMMVVGVPAAGLLALVVLIVAVAQLPPWLVLLPVAFWVYSVESTLVATIFLVYALIVSFADMVLKPMFLGRGVDAPMPIILLGAIGGLIVSGIVGLFVGAVVLTLGYKLFDAWLRVGEAADEAAVEAPGTAENP